MVRDLEQLAPEEPATVLWCGERFGYDALRARRDFARLRDAVSFVGSELPLAGRLTAWAISGNQLIPPEGVAALYDGLVAA